MLGASTIGHHSVPRRNGDLLAGRQTLVFARLVSGVLAGPTRTFAHSIWIAGRARRCRAAFPTEPSDNCLLAGLARASGGGEDCAPS
jgi:hypothetical protein